MNKMKIRKNDEVVVLRGKDKGKTGILLNNHLDIQGIFTGLASCLGVFLTKKNHCVILSHFR